MPPLPASPLRLGRGGCSRAAGDAQVFGKGSADDPAGGKNDRPEQFFRIIVRCCNQQKDFD